jgi:hypothetical protein
VYAVTINTCRWNKHRTQHIVIHLHRKCCSVINCSVYCDVFTLLETPFGLLLRVFTTLLVATTITFYNVRTSLPCWFFILVGSLIAGFLVAALIWLLWSPPDVASLIGSFDRLLWSAPLIFSSDVASLIDSFDLLGSYFLPPWNRVLAPRIEDTLSKGSLGGGGALTQRCCGISCCGNSTIRSFLCSGNLFSFFVA